MEPIRYNRNKHYQRGYRGPHRRRPYNRPHCSNWQTSQRTFDERGREKMSDNQRFHDSVEIDEAIQPKLTPLEEKSKNFLHKVLNQAGIRSKLVFLETIDNAVQTLQGTVDNCKLQIQIIENPPKGFSLSIDNEVLAEGMFSSKKEAKESLAKKALDILKNDCFYIIKKQEFEEVSGKTQETEAEKPSTSFEGSKAHQMMLKMGWSGKGLGVNEQGQEKTVAETISQNISKQGLGMDNVFKKIHKILEDYSKSDKMSLLKFDPDFTSDERAHIHTIANKFGLKSKSEGKGEQRRITVTKKLNRVDLVYNLLTCGLENSLYKLIIPKKFEHLWWVEEDEDFDEFQPSFAC